MKPTNLTLFFVLCLSSIAFAQKTIDGVAAIVGDKIILHSAVEGQYSQLVAQGITGDPLQMKCQLLEEQLYQKLLAHQAEVDSVQVTEMEVSDAINQRIQYFVSQIGSEQKLEEYFGKSINQIKDEFRSVFKDQILAQRMESSISSNVTVTPEDVRMFFYKIPEDSLPIIPLEMEVSQLVILPDVDAKEKTRIEMKLVEFKKRVLSGEDFGILATLYSQDPGSAKKNGELGFMSRGMLVPEFEAAAFRLQEGELSDVIQTKFGFHLIQMIERRGEQINVRHILIKPNPTELGLLKAKSKLDSILNLISLDSISFEEAAMKFSDDDSKNNGGLLINSQTGTSSFTKEELDPSILFAVNNMSQGEYSEPLSYTTLDDRKGYRSVRLNKKTNSHRANLADDYDKIYNATLQEKKSSVTKDWIKEKVEKTYIKIQSNYTCDWENNWRK